MLIKTEIEDIMIETSEAYSFSRYGPTAWYKSIENLSNMGYNRKEIVDILNSKYMRWAADAFSGWVGDEDHGYEICDGNEIRMYHDQYAKSGKLRIKDL